MPSNNKRKKGDLKNQLYDDIKKEDDQPFILIKERKNQRDVGW